MRLVRREMSELYKYAAASGAALLVDAGVLAALVSGAGLPYMPAAAISFVAGGVFLYILSVKVVFRYRRMQNPALELPLFIALGLVGLAVNCVVMFVAISAWHVNYLVAKGAAAIFTFSVNYLLRRNAMFSRLGRPHPPYVLAD